jgi:SAM-dependent methyltransferase
VTDAALERFRTAFRNAPPEAVEWLTPQATGDRRPWTVEGREFRSFPDTFRDVLAWYKADLMDRWRPFGLALDPMVTERVSAALGALCSRTGVRDYDAGPLARYTAVDHRIQTMLGTPVRRVLDFGSGIGRTVYAWAPDAAVVSVDATESLYLLQRASYAALYGARFVDAIDDGDATAAHFHRDPSPGDVLHLPTWLLAMVPDDSVSLIVAAHVLQEIPEATLRHVLAHFKRVIAPGGLLYVRDKEFWAPMHHVRVGRELLRQGWELAYRYPGSEGRDIVGTPRLWVFTGEDTRRYFQHARRLKRIFLPSYGLGRRSWRDYGLPI